MEDKKQVTEKAPEYYITFQDLPAKETKVNGEWISEYADWENVTSPFYKELGYRPVWCVPVTTLGETIFNCLLAEPNFPAIMYILKAKKEPLWIDKIKWQEAINAAENNKAVITDEQIADDDVPYGMREAVFDRAGVDHDYKIVTYNMVMGISDWIAGRTELGSIRIPEIRFKSEEQKKPYLLMRQMFDCVNGFDMVSLAEAYRAMGADFPERRAFLKCDMQ